jgi:putative transposase
MIDRTHPLPVRRQCQLLKLARSTAYYHPTPVSETGLALMRRIDELHLQYPFAGARMLRNLLRQEGHAIGRRHVATLMRRMGIEALYRKPALSRRIRPSDLPLSPARSGDLTAQSCLGRRYYLYPDGAGLCVFVCRPRLGQSPGVGVAAVQHADHRLLSGGGAGGCDPLWRPTIFNTDQGCQFTSQEFTGLLTHHGIQISMDGKGCWRDNVFVERLWKSIKYEEVYLHAYETVEAAPGRGALSDVLQPDQATSGA